MNEEEYKEAINKINKKSTPRASPSNTKYFINNSLVEDTPIRNITPRDLTYYKKRFKHLSMNEIVEGLKNGQYPNGKSQSDIDALETDYFGPSIKQRPYDDPSTMYETTGNVTIDKTSFKWEIPKLDFDYYNSTEIEKQKEPEKMKVDENEEIIINLMETADHYTLEEMNRTISCFSFDKHAKEYNECLDKHLRILNSFKKLPNA